MKALGFGQVLWDVVACRNGEIRYSIGGSMFNVLAQLSQLGNDSAMLTAFGDDELGKRAVNAMRTLGVRPLIPPPVSAPTGTVRVSYDETGNPRYEMDDFLAWDEITLTENMRKQLEEMQPGLFCFSVIEQRNPVSRGTLREILESMRFHTVFADLSLRSPYYDKELVEWTAAHCDILKMNTAEMHETARLLSVPSEKFPDFAAAMAKKFPLRAVVVTDGKNGADCWEEGRVEHADAYSVQETDPVGAGDAFSAGMLDQLYRGSSLAQACDFGAKLGAYVCTQQGALPALDREWLNRLGRST